MTISSAGIGSGLDVNSIVSQLMAIEQAAAHRAQTKATAIQTHGLRVRQDQERRLDAARPREQAREHRRPGARPSATRRAARSRRRPTTPRPARTRSRSRRWPACRRSPPAPPCRRRRRRAPARSASSSAARAPGRPASRRRPARPRSTSPWRRPTRSPTVRDKINAAGAGVTALIMTDASGSRLLIRSNTSGAANAFRTSGIASLAFDPSAGVADDDAEPDRRRRGRDRQRPGRHLDRATRSRTSSTA